MQSVYYYVVAGGLHAHSTFSRYTCCVTHSPHTCSRGACGLAVAAGGPAASRLRARSTVPGPEQGILLAEVGGVTSCLSAPVIGHYPGTKFRALDDPEILRDCATRPETRSTS